MSNAVERALNRASAEQRERNQQVIEEARRNIKLVSVHDDIKPSDSRGNIDQAQVIEEARRNIPFDTMKDVNEVSQTVQQTRNNKFSYMSKYVNLNSDTQDRIEHIEQGGGNNGHGGNAVDRALDRQDQIKQDQVRYDQERKDQERQQEQAQDLGR